MAVSVKSLFNILLCSAGFISAFVTVYNLFYFLSNFDQQHHVQQKNVNNSAPEKYPTPLIYLKDLDGYGEIKLAMLSNTVLLIVFIAQHSLMASSKVKSVIGLMGLADIERSLYILCTSGALQQRYFEQTRKLRQVRYNSWWRDRKYGTLQNLQMVMRFWTTIHGVQLWSVQETVFEWPIQLAHFYAWSVVYMGSITMDIGELLGVKQVYYTMCGLPPPLKYKSSELQRLYLHMRHPSYIGFTIILLIRPMMTADRVLLAFVWISYMVGRWKTDAKDYRYVKRQMERKFHFIHQRGLK